MSDKRRLRIHAARVATVAMLVVLACYALCAFGLGIFVTHRLTAEADGRVRAALGRAGTLSLRAPSAPTGPAPSGNGDLDDAPVFFWYVPARGPVEPLTAGAPGISAHGWSAAPVTRAAGGTVFRFAAVRRDGGWVVAGQSIADVRRVESALVLPEILFGLLLALATFVGSLLVALRASAPLDLIRRRQAEFTADASHELRTPLSVVEAEVDLALRRRRDPAEYEAVLGRIAAEGRRLRRIVDDLLWLARADSGAETPTRPELADVEAVVGSCVARFEVVAARNGLTLRFASEGQDACVVKVPPELVDRLAGVLIDNACKYAGASGTVSVVVRSTPTRVALQVDDSGPGIPPAERATVFDRFRRATSEGAGAGLGLAIADSVVRMTEGTWSVGDAALGGARMEVSWRRIPEPAHGGRPHTTARSQSLAPSDAVAGRPAGDPDLSSTPS